MRIEFEDNRKIFRLISDEMEYAFQVTSEGNLRNLHWGAKVDDLVPYDVLAEERDSMEYPGSRTCYSREYTSEEPFDYSSPCLRVRFFDGSETLRLKYARHIIKDDELTVTLGDEFYPLEVDLIYKTFGNLPIIGRSAVIRNLGDKPIQLLTAKSASLQLPQGRDFRLTHYSGDWGSEYQRNQVMVTKARVQIETNRLTDAANHQFQFFALDENGMATETFGEVYFGILQWSGDFQTTVEMQHTQYSKQLSVVSGISDFSAQIPLVSHEKFETPTILIGFSDSGFEHMSEMLYDLQIDYILPKGKRTDKAHGVRPIIYNTWYPYEFGIDEKKVLDIIPKAKEIGAELLVIDDGWMKGRTDNKCGLGDWVIDRERFPRGLGHISDEVHKNGMLFGIWVEPEMVNPDSDLYKSHPDWILSEPNRERSLMKTQCILDMSQDCIRDWAIDWLDKLITEEKLDYLKWDMNREVSELGLNAIEQGKAVKYMRNIEYIWQHLNEKFPDLLMENCAAGGGRADYAMLKYTDRVNRSDNADVVDAMILHEGFATFFLPKLAGGAGNIPPSPYADYLNGRSVPLDFRINMGMTGSMSIGINILKSDDEELENLKEATKRFKELRPALQDSYFYRICSARENPYCVWQYVRRNRSEFTVFAFGHGMHQWDKQLPSFRMRGLKPDEIYRCGEMKMTGRALMNLGVHISLKGDYDSVVMTWRGTEISKK